MGLPSVDMTELDGALQVLPAGVGDIPAVIGPCASGTKETPAAFASTGDIKTNFVAGPGAELAAYIMQKTGKVAVMVRSDTTTDGACGAVDSTGKTGTSVVTADATVDPYDEYEAMARIVKGGTIGTAGITYQTSLDAGRSWSAVTALGTATSITIADGNVKFLLASGTLVAGDYWSCSTTQPKEGTDDLAAALLALEETLLEWNFVAIATPQDAAGIAAIDTWLQHIKTAKKMAKAAIVSVRGPTSLESEAAYRTALETMLASTSSTRILCGAGYAETLSAISSRQYKRPAAWVGAARAAWLKNPARQDMAAPSLGPVWSDVRIRDITTRGRKVGLHDEALDPGLDDLRLMTLCTYPDPKMTGVYITHSRLLSPLGSDFRWWQYRKVMNKIHDVVQVVLTKRLLDPVQVYARGPKKGLIVETEAVGIETDVNEAVSSAVRGGPDVSAHKFILSRTDNLLSGAPMTSKSRVVPLAYPDNIAVEQSFVNPAIAQAV